MAKNYPHDTYLDAIVFGIYTELQSTEHKDICMQSYDWIGWLGGAPKEWDGLEERLDHALEDFKQKSVFPLIVTVNESISISIQDVALYWEREDGLRGIPALPMGEHAPLLPTDGLAISDFERFTQNKKEIPVERIYLYPMQLKVKINIPMQYDASWHDALADWVQKNIAPFVKRVLEEQGISNLKDFGIQSVDAAGYWTNCARVRLPEWFSERERAWLEKQIKAAPEKGSSHL